MKKVSKPKTAEFKFPKSPTGIQGLDDITGGGLPKGRPTLLLGNTGCGKTIMGMEFVLNGIALYDEPGVFIAFEENTDEVVTNVKSLAYNLDEHIAKNKLYLEHVKINRNEIVETGEYNMEGLFVRIGQAIDKVKAKRIVLDSLDTLFEGLNSNILRAEFIRLFSWLKEKKVTALITSEIGETFLTRHGLAEYVADCVIVLDNRVTNQVATRRLRIVKYRGSMHGNNEYPFVIEGTGINVLPLISEALQQKISTQRVSSGIEELDAMLGKKGYYRGSSVLISGTAGTGKTSIAASFAYSICKKKERCLFCAFEEAPNQILRNMNSIGLSLDGFLKAGQLHFYYSRPTLQNLELHFLAIKKMIKELNPDVVVLDPITNLMTDGPNSDVRSMLTRFVDYLKIEQITVLFTAAITIGSIAQNPSDEGISSMVDTWIMVQDIEVEAERSRSLCVIKSRGMIHSTEVRRFNISSKGITITSYSKHEKATIDRIRRSMEQESLSTEQ